MGSTLTDRVREAVQGTAPAPPEMAPEGAAEHGEYERAVDGAMEWLGQYEAHFVRALPEHISVREFFAALREALPGLRRCTAASILQAALTCARFGLVPDGHHAVLVADGPLAVFIPMYPGLVELMLRSGRVLSVHVGEIYKTDEWTYEPSAPPPADFTLRPRPHLPRAERGEPILAYAFCWMLGPGGRPVRSHVVLMGREEAEEIRDLHSRAYQRAEEGGTRDSAWHRFFVRMWIKTALRRLAKLVPASAEVVQLLKADEAGELGKPQILYAPEPARRSQGRPLPRKGRGRGRRRSQPRKRSRAQRRNGGRRRTS